MSKLHNEKTEKRDADKPHWIIVNRKRESIWKQAYYSYDEAKAEFNFQVAALRPGYKHGFEIETIFPNGSHQNNIEAEKKSRVDSLEDWAEQAVASF